MGKLPKGISNYEELVRDNCIYVDKTMYIEKLENLSDKRIMFLRPRKFGKTLFTSTIENYYDILKKDQFGELFGNTYIGKNPTKNKNSYHILKFDFSGIDTSTVESTLNGFREKVEIGIKKFIQRYNIEFYINPEMTTEGLLENLFMTFELKKKQEEIYVIIDEYDFFANELIDFKTNEFKDLASKNRKIRVWYEILKRGTETVVDRIFMTGIVPITLDSLTSGFNITRDITQCREFKDMIGFNEEDVKYLMQELKIDSKTQEELMPIIKENYYGYIFSDELKDYLEEYKICNSNLILYFLNNYIKDKNASEKLVDINIISDYSKIEAFMNLCKNTGKIQILEKIVSGENVESELIEKFNCEITFEKKELISLLYYLGYLTIKNKEYGILEFGIPNEIIRQIYYEKG